MKNKQMHTAGNSNKFIILLTFILFINVGTSKIKGSDAAPELINYQGFLVDVNGVPLGNNNSENYKIKFEIWSDQTQGNLIWSEQQDVTVNKGHFNILLGESDTSSSNLSAAFSGSDADTRYLSITPDIDKNNIFDTGEIISPRMRLLSNPYSFLANRAVTADNLSKPEYTVNPSNVANASTHIQLKYDSDGQDRDGFRLKSQYGQVGLDPNNSAASTSVKDNGTFSIQQSDNQNNWLNRLTIDGNGDIHASGSINTASQISSNNDISTGGKFVGHGTIPIGGIIMWNGATAPPGWAICNGLNGTPDLRDRFIVGAGRSYNVTNIGGAETVTLNVNQIPSHAHSGTTNNDGAHNHRNNDWWSVHAYNSSWGGTRRTVIGTDRASYNAIDSGGSAHKHSFTTNSTGGSKSHENRPPYFALMFIQRKQ